MKKIKIAYIGGGSKAWARVFMGDLALSDGLGGELALYDIDIESAERNKRIGERINNSQKTKSIFEYKVYEKLEDALQGATFVVISILPGTFEEMRSDVHAPEAYGIYQSVGDTAGPGGVLRAMRTLPIYEDFARKIKDICPKAWVINFTNPMSACTKILYEIFPDVKAFGCCHEVFHAQEFLCKVLQETRGIKISRKDFYSDACGINHFTWITEAKYKDIDLLSLIPEFEEKYFEDGYYEYADTRGRFAWHDDMFAYGNKVKMDLYNKYGVLAAAGDRHLAEFMPSTWYLKDPSTVDKWCFRLTTVDFRIKQQQERIKNTIAMANGEKEFVLEKSNEEAVEILKALLGMGDLVTNVNLPNRGQMPQMPLGSIVETNCMFSNDKIAPILANELPINVCNLVHRCCLNVDATVEAIEKRDLNGLYLAFANQALCNCLTPEQSKNLFRTMCYNTRKYLDPYYDLDGYFNK